MKLSGTRTIKLGVFEPFTVEIPGEVGTPLMYQPQHVERIERIESNAPRVLCRRNGEPLVWQNGEMIARTKSGRVGFVIEPGDRVEEDY